MRFIFLFISALFSLLAIGQKSDPMPSINLYISKTKLGSGIDKQNQGVIDRQLLSLFSDGVPVNDKASAFIVQPSVDLLEQGQIEGMDNRQTAKLNLQLQLVYSFTSEVVAVTDVLLVGSGEKSSEAIRKAVITARKANPSLKKTLASFRQSAATFMDENCNSFLKVAKDAEKMGDLHKAFSVLHAVPTEVACFDKVTDEKVELFRKWQENECGSQLNKARAARAERNYSKALGILSSFDASAPCFEEAKQLVTSMENIIDEKQKADYEWMFKVYAEKNKSETARWNAMNSLFLGWLKASDHYTEILHSSDN